MRFFALAMAAFVASTPAIAEGWQEYTYPDFAFAVSFPATPTVETTTYQTADGQSVEAHVYTVVQDHTALKMTIADLSGIETSESAVIDHAIKVMAQGGEVNVDIAARVRRVFGRNLSITQPDGSRVLAAVFLFKDRLYQIEGKALLGSNGTGDAIRFQQSLMFTDSTSNRPDGAPGAGEYGAGRGNRRCQNAQNAQNAEGCRRRGQQGLNLIAPQ
jgi:hypothetical protein